MWSYRKVTGGFDIFRDGQWMGWTAGRVADARETIRQMKITYGG